MDVHLINPMLNPFGGSEHRTLELAELITGRAKVNIWSEADFPDATYRNRTIPIRIRPFLGQFPRGGHIVLVGAYFWIGRWLAFARPKHLTIIFNTPEAWKLHNVICRLFSLGIDCPIDIKYAAQWLAHATGISGLSMPSPVNLQKFKPRTRNSKSIGEKFTIGRLSRSSNDKHHPEDLLVYQKLTQAGYRVRIMGSTALHEVLRGDPSVDLLPSGTENAVEFLQTLDCFYYRTAPSWFEPHGRVIHEAMATALPVVCGRLGGYREFIEEGITGFLINDTNEAIETILSLAQNKEYADRIGGNGRQKVESIFSDMAIENLISSLVSPTDCGERASTLIWKSKIFLCNNEVSS